MKINSGLFLAISVTVAGQVLYHVVARSMGRTRPPYEIVAIAYTVSLLVVTVVGLSTRQIELLNVFKSFDLLPGFLIGIAVATVELGYLYSYRKGLPISIGALSMLAITTIILVPVGALFFQEVLSVKIVMGILLTVLGIWLMML